MRTGGPNSPGSNPDSAATGRWWPLPESCLIAVWHVLTHGVADRHAEPAQVACAFFALAYDVGVARLPDGHSAKSFTRHQLDRLGIGQYLDVIPWGTKQVKLPRLRLRVPDG